MDKPAISLVALLLCVSLSTFGQELISSGGRSFSTIEGSITYSIGEVIIETVVKEDNFITQGLNQTQIVITSNSFQNAPEDIGIYPNPSAGKVAFYGYSIEAEVNYIIADVSGKILSQGVAKGQIDVSFLSAGIYFITIKVEKKGANVFQLIKQ